MSIRIELAAGAMRCLVLPDAGGSLGGLWHGQQALLRDCAAVTGNDPTMLAGFPLVPYSNRIADARFEWQGKTVRLRRNRADELHALHGLGWQRPWSITEQEPASVTLMLEHAGDADWPWPFRARQQLSLGADRLEIALSARNLAPDPVPLAIGHHPYFPRAGAWVNLRAGKVWLADSANLPDRALPPEGNFSLTNGPVIEGREIDNCYQHVAWPVTLGWQGRDHALAIEAGPEMPCAVVYSNADADALCVEPVAHVSNALNLACPDCAMPVVDPGEVSQATICYRLVSVR